MCYILFGNINEEAFDRSFVSVSEKYGFVRNKEKLTKKDIRFSTDIKGGVYFYLKYGYCDCDTPIGSGDISGNELQKYIAWFQELKKCKKLKMIHIMKHWVGQGGPKVLQPTVFINIDEADVPFLANMKDETVYRIEYFKRY